MSIQADLIAASEELATKRTRLADMFRELDKVTDPAKRDEMGAAIKALNDELAPINDRVADLQGLRESERANADALKAMRSAPRQVEPDLGSSRDGQPQGQEDILSDGIKSIRELMTTGLSTYGIKHFGGFRGEIGELAIKTLLTSADLTPLEQRAPSVVLSGQEERTVADLMLSGTTNAQVVSYYQETTYTNAAAETDEGSLKPESTLDFTLRQDNVRKIATWIPVTDEMMEDVPAFESYIRGRLAFMVKQREELQLLRGAGTGITILGLYNRTGVQTVTGYGESTIDSILHAITLVQANAFVDPTAMVVHPNDWFNIRASKDTTGNYLLGPATLDPNAARPWGLQVRVTTNALENTLLVGAFNQAQVFRRSGISVAISTENEDYFTKNKVAVRAEERLALAVYRPIAFCKVEAVVIGS